MAARGLEQVQRKRLREYERRWSGKLIKGSLPEMEGKLMLGANLMCGEDALRLRAIGIIGYGKSGFGVTAAQKYEQHSTAA